MTTPRAYYNEFDPHAAAVLRELIKANQIAPGDVDERSIMDVTPNDLAGYTQCHFFAGIGIWSLALRRAGWPDHRPVWTGSCPCQPFSAAGKGVGFDDERHLWPAFFHLIDERRPESLFGEQVASKDGLAWIDLVHADMEGTGYAVRAQDLCAAGFGAPHIRQRLVFRADRSPLEFTARDGRFEWGTERAGRGVVARCEPDGLADAAHERGEWSGDRRAGWGIEHPDRGSVGGLVDTERDVSGWRSREASATEDRRGRVEESGHHGLVDAGSSARRLADLHVDGLQGRTVPALLGTGRRDEGDATGRGGASLVGGLADANGRDARAEREQSGGQQRLVSEDGGTGFMGRIERPGPTNGFWRDADWLFCRDDKWRSIEPGTFPLAHGYPARVGFLRTYGNAIVPQKIQAFIEATEEDVI